MFLSSLREQDICTRRLRSEHARMWPESLKASIESAEIDDRHIYLRLRHVVDTPLIAGFARDIDGKIAYPFRPLTLQMETKRVPHNQEVARALSAHLRSPQSRRAVAEYLLAPCRVSLKEWLYRRALARGDPPLAATELVRHCSRTLPPHLWTPAMGLGSFWDEITRLLSGRTPLPE